MVDLEVARFETEPLKEIMRYEIHEGAYILKNGLQVYRSTTGEGRAGKRWIFSIMREATEEDLEENHYLNSVGEIIWETMVEVKHCPYCGMKLPATDEAEASDLPWFEHYDSSGWNTKIS